MTNNTKPRYIVLAAASEAHHRQLVEMLKPEIVESISYIDIEPEVCNPDKDEIDEGLYLKVDR